MGLGQNHCFGSQATIQPEPENAIAAGWVSALRRRNRLQSQNQANSVPANTWSVLHPITAEDATAMAAMRALVEPNKGRLQGTAARRVPFDSIMERVAAPESVTYEADTVGGVSGLWCKPEGARPGEVVLHVHGGWFNWGSAQAFRHMVSSLI